MHLAINNKATQTQRISDFNQSIPVGHEKIALKTPLVMD